VRIPLVGWVRDRLADRRMRHYLQAAPRRAIADLVDGEPARVCGRIAPYGDEVLVAPVSGRSCAYYSLVVDHVVPIELGRGTRFQLDVARTQDGMAFEIVDDTGRAVVDPLHASVSSRFDYASSKLRGHATALIDKLGLERSFGRKEQFRFREAVLALDEPIAVFGAGVRETDPDAASRAGERDYRDGVPMRVRMTGTARYPLMLSDDPRALE
jgi:hypothetical protein